MSLEIYGYYIDEENKNPIIMGFIKETKNMPLWLKNNANRELIYELNRDKKILSHWKWKSEQERWGRMSTQKRKSNNVIINIEEKINNDKETKKKRRILKQEKGIKKTRW